MSRIKSHYVAQIVIDHDVDLSEPGITITPDEIKRNLKRRSTPTIKEVLQDIVDKYGKVEVTEMLNDVIEVEE